MDEYEVIEVLRSLVRQSLVQAEKVTDGTARYRMLETLRQYGEQRLSNTRVNEKVQDRHFRYYLDLIEQAEPELRGSHQVLWLDQLRTEQDNLRAASTWGDKRASGALQVAKFGLAQSLRLSRRFVRILGTAGASGRGAPMDGESTWPCQALNRRQHCVRSCSAGLARWLKNKAIIRRHGSFTRTA